MVYCKNLIDILNKVEKSQSNRTGGEKVSYIYRYFSWFLISLFYLIDHTGGTILYKLGIVSLFYAATRIMAGLYTRFKGDPGKLRLTILIEMLLSVCLLVPSGGLNSTFVWYALNPVLIAASLLSPCFCWLNMFIYIIGAVLITFTFFNETHSTLLNVTYENLYIILAYVLIIFAVQLLSTLTKEQYKQSEELQIKSRELEEVNESLRSANDRIGDLIKHIMSLYKVIEAFNIHDNPEKIPSAIADYAAKFTAAGIAFFWVSPCELYDSAFISRDNVIADIPLEISQDIKLSWDNIKEKDGSYEIMAGGRQFLAVTVKSSSRYYGLIGIESGSIDFPDLTRLQYGKLLMFLSDISSIIFERINLEDISDHLMIVEEQNRIANEIHDSVSQRMFGIVCAMHSLSLKWEDMDKEEIRKQIDAVEESANFTMHELRSSIYHLSSQKRGDKVLFSSIREHIDAFSKLNNIEVDMKVTGDEEALSFPLKKALYRIVCEATGNATRHGMCKKVGVVLDFKPLKIYLTITDDGKGFPIESLKQKDGSGLGIYNMRTMVESFGGEFKISSRINKGTEIQIIIPQRNIHSDVQGGIA